MSLVVDASALVPALADAGPLGTSCRRSMRSQRLIAPQGIDLEVISALRSMMFDGAIEGHVAEEAVDDLGRIRMTRVPTVTLHQRIWNLRHNVSAYDAAFVALAEALRAPLLTLDLRLSRADGPTCEFVTPGLDD